MIDVHVVFETSLFEPYMHLEVQSHILPGGDVRILGGSSQLVTS